MHGKGSYNITVFCQSVIHEDVSECEVEEQIWANFQDSDPSVTIVKIKASTGGQIDSGKRKIKCVGVQMVVHFTKQMAKNEKHRVTSIVNWIKYTGGE